jgi:hypothetical protein
LVVRWRIQSKHDLCATSLVDWDSIDPVITRAIGDEEVRIATVVAVENLIRVGSNALTAELHAAAFDSRCLALDPNELLTEI